MNGRKLVVLSGRTKGAAFDLTEPQVSAGSESDNSICLKGKRVSRHHAVLVRTNGEYSLRDMSPRIGTLLNDQPTKEAHLKVGDRIRIGEFELSYEAATGTATAIDTLSAMTLPQPAEIATPIIPVVAVPDPIPEYQHRIAELTQETERLAGKLKLANEAMESLRAQLRTRSDQEANLMGRLKNVSQENAALIKLNDKFQAKISKLEAATAAKSSPVKEEITAPPAKAPVEQDKVSDQTVDSKTVAVESDEAQMAAARAQEEAVARQRSTAKTNEQFDSLRRTIVEKKNLRAQMTLLDRLLLPFRDTMRLTQKPAHIDPK